MQEMSNTGVWTMLAHARMLSVYIVTEPTQVPRKRRELIEDLKGFCRRAPPDLRTLGASALQLVETTDINKLYASLAHKGELNTAFAAIKAKACEGTEILPAF